MDNSSSIACHARLTASSRIENSSITKEEQLQLLWIHDLYITFHFEVYINLYIRPTIESKTYLGCHGTRRMQEAHGVPPSDSKLESDLHNTRARSAPYSACRANGNIDSSIQ